MPTETIRYEFGWSGQDFSCDSDSDVILKHFPGINPVMGTSHPLAQSLAGTSRPQPPMPLSRAVQDFVSAQNGLRRCADGMTWVVVCLQQLDFCSELKPHELHVVVVGWCISPKPVACSPMVALSASCGMHDLHNWIGEAVTHFSLSAIHLVLRGSSMD